jgi:ankyrin repeat protein
MSREFFDAIKSGNQDTYNRIVPSINPDLPDTNGDCAIHIAFKNDRTAMYDDLVERGALLNKPDGNGDTLLHLAARVGKEALCKTLMGKDIKLLAAANKSGKKPVDVATDGGFNALATLMAKLSKFEGLKKAAFAGKDALATHFKGLSKQEKGDLVKLTDVNGETVLHLMAKRPLGKGNRDKGGDVVADVIAAGADVNAVNPDGQTPLYGAAFKCNNGMLNALLTGGANVNVTDARGWTPLDQAAAMGGLDPDTEDLLLAKGAKGKEVKLEGVVKSTVDVLVAAALTDQTEPLKQKEALDKLRASLEDLYRNPQFRPILDLAALDAVGERKGDKKALRIYLSSGESTASINGDGAGRGSYSGDKGGKATNNLSLGLKRPDEDLGGTLVHELTHHAAFQLFQNGGKPYKDDDEDGESEHLEAYEKMARSTHLAVGEQEKEVAQTIIGRVAGYAADDMVQEFIAGVPQSVYLYGEEMVHNLAPQCLNDFLRVSQDSGTFVSTNNPGLDNTALVLKVNAKGPIKPAYEGLQALDTAEVSVDSLVELIGKELIAKGGKATTGDKSLAFPCSNSDFEPTDEVAHKAALARVRKALTAAFDGDALPPKITGDALRTLVSTTTDLVQSKTDETVLKKAVAVNTKLWTRFAQSDFVEAKVKAGGELSDRDIAEATVFAAELKAWKELGTQAEAPEVSGKKHKQMVEAMVTELGRLDTTDAAKKKRIKDNALTFIDTQSKAIVGSKAEGFYKKGPKKLGTRNPDHVSVNVNEAKNKWLAALRTY